MAVTIHHLSSNEIALMRGLSGVFGEVFDEADTYLANRPSDAYLRQLLGGDSFIAVVALHDGQVIGGLAAYELKKFEQQRSEIYLYDLAVLSQQRRRGVATALIHRLKEIAAERRAHVIFVQADTGAEDTAAIALYSKLGRREAVLHFDIAVDRGQDGE